MSLTKQEKTQIISEYRRDNQDSGSPEVQVAVLTKRINELTKHLQAHVKDHASRRGLLMLVSRRRCQLDYLKQTNPERYRELIQKLEIRK